jgi:hypothetical protein
MVALADLRPDKPSVIGGVERITDEPCVELYHHVVAILAAAILKLSADQRQCSRSVPHHSLFA